MLNYEVRLEQLYEDKNNFIKKKEEFIQRFDTKIKEIDELIVQLQEYKKRYDQNAAESLELVSAANKILSDKKAWELQDPDNTSVEYSDLELNKPFEERGLNNSESEYLIDEEIPETVDSEESVTSNHEANVEEEQTYLKHSEPDIVAKENTDIQEQLSEPETELVKEELVEDNMAEEIGETEKGNIEQNNTEPEYKDSYAPEYEVPEDNSSYNPNIFKTDSPDLEDDKPFEHSQKSSDSKQVSDDDELITRPKKKFFGFGKK